MSSLSAFLSAPAGFAAVLIPFFASLLAFFWNLELLVFLNSLVFLLFFYFFLDRSFVKNSFYLPAGRAAFFSALVLSAFSAVLSPVRGLVGFEYSSFLASCLLFLVFLNLEEKPLDKGLSAVYFIFAAMLLVALYQVYTTPWDEALSTFKNANSFALFCLLATGLSLEKGNRLMALCFLIMLLLTRSAGALFSLSAAALLYRLEKTGSSPLKKCVVGLLLILAVAAALFFLADHPSFRERLSLWKGAVSMIGERPLSGWGAGSFSGLYGAFHRPSGGFSSVYAHNYYLEFVAENGILAGCLWFYFLFSLAFSSSGFYRYALIAALIHGLWDFGLSQTNNLWFFFLLAGLSPGNRTKCSIKPVLARLPALFLVAGALKWFSLCLTGLVTEAVMKRAYASLAEGRPEEALELLSKRAETDPSSFELRAVSSEIMLGLAAEKKDRRLFFRAAVEMERLLIINPYYVPAYERLGRIYSAAGENKILEELEKRKRIYLKWD